MFSDLYYSLFSDPNAKEFSRFCYDCQCLTYFCYFKGTYTELFYSFHIPSLFVLWPMYVTYVLCTFVMNE